jgi:hypothetical protein
LIDPYSIAGRTAHTGLSNDLRLDFILIFYDLIFPFGNVYKVCDSVSIFINIYWWGKVMKRSLIYTAVFSAMLVMTGCGGGDGSDHQNAEQNEKPSNTPLTQQQKEKILTVSEHSHHIAARESLALGMVDTAIYGVDGIVEDDEQCTSGTYTNIKGVINFNQCDGLFYKFEAGQYQSLIAKSGTVTVKNGEYSYQNLVLENPETKETQTITGSLKSDVNDTSATLATNNLIVNASEKTQNSFYNVKYVFENYKLNYKLKSDTELNITTNGTLSVVNSPVGDYKIKFETPTPLALRVSEDDEDSFPHQGVIKVEDVNNKATTTLSVIPNTNNVQYTITSGNEKLIDRVQTWEEILGLNVQGKSDLDNITPVENTDHFISFTGVVGSYQDYNTNEIKSAKGCSVVRSGKNLTINIPDLNVSVSVQANSLEVQPSTGGQGLIFITDSEDKGGHMQTNDGFSEKVIRSAWIVLDKKSYSCSDYDK